MTYCVALNMDCGLAFMSDTRTNAGVDSISTFKKMFSWTKPGERVIVLLAAGNLATTQSVVSLLDERAKAPHERSPSLLETPSMYQTARVVGDLLKEVISGSVPAGQNQDAFGASFILGGQIRGTEPRLFMIYPEGNFVEAGADTPFFQIGEVKYGKPILVRAFDPEMSFAEAAKLLLVSFDSTVKSQPVGRIAARHAVLRARQFRPRQADTRHRRRWLLSQDFRRLVGRAEDGLSPTARFSALIRRAGSTAVRKSLQSAAFRFFLFERKTKASLRRCI